MFKKRKNINAPTMTKEEIQKKFEETPLEKGDTLAIVLAGMSVLLPMVLLICGIFVAVIWLIFLR